MIGMTITEEPVQPVMFRRLHQEAMQPIEAGEDAIVYIENGQHILVKDSPHLIKGIADLLTIQGIPFKSFRFEGVENINELFRGLGFR